MTVREVTDAGPGARTTTANTWAASAWTAWSAHYDTVRGWLAQALEAGPRKPGD